MSVKSERHSIDQKKTIEGEKRRLRTLAEQRNDDIVFRIHRESLVSKSLECWRLSFRSRSYNEEKYTKGQCECAIPGDLQHLTQRTQLLPGRASFRIKSDFSGNSTGLPIYWRSK